jgi:uncharacterized protein with HEPN domain
MKDDRVCIAQILDAVEKIERFVVGASKEDFLNDQKLQSAVIMQLALIDELAKRVSEETRERVDLPWKDIAGFRDRAIHEYYSIDAEVVWTTIADNIPMLKNALASRGV